MRLRTGPCYRCIPALLQEHIFGRFEDSKAREMVVDCDRRDQCWEMFGPRLQSVSELEYSTVPAV